MSSGRVKTTFFSDSMITSKSEYLRPVAPGPPLKSVSPEVAAYEAGFIDRAQLEKLAEPLLKSGYGEYLRAY